MAQDISSSLNTIKKQSIIVLAQNVNIRFPQLKDNLIREAKISGGIFKSLLWMLQFNQNTLSSSNVSAAFLLAYLDFYALYSLIYSNYEVFNGLKTISEKKYEYIHELYKSLGNLIKEKEKSIDYMFVQQISFNNTIRINQKISGFLNRKNKVSIPLSFKEILTLPVRSEKIINPSYLTFHDTDSAINEAYSENGIDYLKYSILRKQNNKVGIPESIIAASDDNSYSIVPDIEGTIFGYFSDTIFVECSGITLSDNSSIESIELIASTNGTDWSNNFSLIPNVKTEILIENDISIGLSILLQDGFNLKIGDRWLINISNNKIEYPSLRLKIGFDFLEPLSYVSFKDESDFKLTINSSNIDRAKFSSIKDTAFVYNDNIGQVGVIEGSINKYEIELSQKNYTIKSKDESLGFLYDFKIKDIIGIQRDYEAHGSIVFESTKMENINTLSLSTKEYIPVSGVHKLDDINIPKCYIEKNILVETQTSKLLIPMIESDILKKDLNIDLNNINQKPLIFEVIIPDEIAEWGTGNEAANYKSRFPIDQSYIISGSDAIQVYDAKLETPVSFDYFSDNGKIQITEYLQKNLQCMLYSIKIHNSLDTCDDNKDNGKWIRAGVDIYYMYYVDEFNDVHLAIRHYDFFNKKLIPFSGNISFHVEMRSSDQLYVTPMMFEFSVSGI